MNIQVIDYSSYIFINLRYTKNNLYIILDFIIIV